MRLPVSAQELMRHVEKPQLRGRIPEFGPGDTLRLTIRVPEGKRERSQLFEGTVIARRGGGTREMVTVRRISFGVGVERTFPIHSPFVSKWEVTGRGKARRAKLYYLREKTGRDARLKKDYGADEVPVVTEAEAAAVEMTPEEKGRADAAKALRDEKKAARKKRQAEKAEKSKAKNKARSESPKPK